MDNHKQERFEMTDAELIKATRALVTSPVSQSMKMADRLTYRLEAANQRIEGLERENVEQRRVLANQKKDYEKLAVAYDEACNNLRADIERLKGLLQNGEKNYQGLERELSAERNARAKAEAKIAAVEREITRWETIIQMGFTPQAVAQHLRQVLATQSAEPASTQRRRNICTGPTCSHGLIPPHYTDGEREPAAANAAPDGWCADCTHRQNAHDGLGRCSWEHCPCRIYIDGDSLAAREREKAPQPSQAIRTDPNIQRACEVLFDFLGSNLISLMLDKCAIPTVIYRPLRALIEDRHAK